MFVAGGGGVIAIEGWKSVVEDDKKKKKVSQSWCLSLVTVGLFSRPLKTRRTSFSKPIPPSRVDGPITLFPENFFFDKMVRTANSLNEWFFFCDSVWVVKR